MPALDADPIHPSHRLRPTGGIGKPRGAALSPSAAPLIRRPRRLHVADAECCRPCSVVLVGELPGELPGEAR